MTRPGQSLHPSPRLLNPQLGVNALLSGVPMSINPPLLENSILRIHRRLDDLVRKCGEMDHKLNLLLVQSNINYGLSHRNTLSAGNMGWGGPSHFEESSFAHPHPIALNSGVPSIHTLPGTSHDLHPLQAPHIPPPPTPGMWTDPVSVLIRSFPRHEQCNTFP